jgi:hypothetical protein
MIPTLGMWRTLLLYNQVHVWYTMPGVPFGAARGSDL